MTSTLDLMIDQVTGEIDSVMLSVAAELRAIREFGSPNYPPKYLRESTEWCRARAEAMRRNWHRDRNLPVPDEEVLVRGFVPDWGNSGDSFGR